MVALTACVIVRSHLEHEPFLNPPRCMGLRLASLEPDHRQQCHRARAPARYRLHGAAEPLFPGVAAIGRRSRSAGTSHVRDSLRWQGYDPEMIDGQLVFRSR